MDNRIKELAEQSGIFKTEEFYQHIDDLQLKKFAELIVRECVGITNELVHREDDGIWTSNELCTDYNGALFEVKRRIERHFGVK